MAVHLRLSSVLHAVNHFYHYLETVSAFYAVPALSYNLQLKEELPDVDTAVQFLMTVAGCNRDVDSRPKHNPVAVEIHQHTLQAAVKDAAKIGRDAGEDNCSQCHSINHYYTGFLQVMFLAGAISHPIQQHCNLNGHELYKTLVLPCSCNTNYDSIVNIMWTNLSQDACGSPNHIIPLLADNPTG